MQGTLGKLQKFSVLPKFEFLYYLGYITLITTIFFFSVRPENARITSKREPLSAGRDYLLECKSYGSRPPATITWWKNSKFMKKAESQVCSKLCRLGMCKKLCRYVQSCIISCSTAEYGNTGCGVFKRGVQNQKGFCIGINILKGNYCILRIGLMGASEVFKNQSFKNQLFLPSHSPN